VPCPRRIVEEQLAVLHIRLCDTCARKGKADDQFCEHCGNTYARPLAAVKQCAQKIPDAWEIKRDVISFRGLLGTGNFGEVRQGVLGADTDVAIKTSKADRMSTKTFLEEAQKMKKLLHPNLCRLWGVCTLEDPILMVMECVGGGSLEDWLHSKRGRGMPITLQCRFLADISAGMAFMQDRHWVHGDLASRNILVSSSGNTLKICDFGHAVRCAEDNVPVVVAHQLPVRWCAPEFFRTRKCNPAVDAWSFGVVVFEVLTRALEPYADEAGGRVENATNKVHSCAVLRHDARLLARDAG
jgi:serine/threonine protein kinase